jgi:5,6,7,8-tetrahydromethanopterin hydro-lyase
VSRLTIERHGDCYAVWSIRELNDADSVAEGVISKKQAEDFVCVCGVFIHWEAADDKKIYDYNYQATKEALKSAMAGKPTIDEIIAGKDKAAHPFRGF